MADQAFVAGGALGGQGGDQGESSPAALKTTLVGILQEGENVNQALGRLKPKVGRKRKATRGKAAAEAEAADAENNKLFESLTEAANDLFTSGFEDIMTDTREKIEASISEPMEGVQGTSQNVWHDDGTADGKAQEHPMYKRDKTDDVSTFKDLPVAEATQVEPVVVETVISTTAAAPLTAAAVEVAEAAAETMEAAVAADTNAAEVKAAAETAAETADALVTADAITENVPAAVVNGTEEAHPAAAGGAGAAAPAAASDGAGEVQSAIETAASAAIPVPTADAPAAAAGTEAQNGTAEKASTEQIPGVGPSEVPAAEISSVQDTTSPAAGTQTTTKPAEGSKPPFKGSKYKTEMCKYFVNNRCTRGQSCLYAHATDEMPPGARPGAHQRAQQHARGGPGGRGGFSSPMGGGRGGGGRGRTTWQHSYNHQQGPHGARGFGGGPNFGGPPHFGGPPQPRPYAPQAPPQPYGQMPPQGYGAPQYGGYQQAPAPGAYPPQAPPAAVPQAQYAQPQAAQAYQGYADPYAGYAAPAAAAAAPQVGYGGQQAYGQQAATPQAYSYAPQAPVQAQAQAARPYAQGGAAPYAGPGPY